MRILIESYSAAARGSYGIVTKNIWERILKEDPTIEVVQHGWFHYPIEKTQWEVIPTLNMHDDAHGLTSFPQVVAKVRPDLVWLLSDPWHNPMIAKMKSRGNYRLVHYCPVDSEPYPITWVPDIASADRIVALGEYGRGVLKACPGLENRKIDVIPHGVDLKFFHPFTKEQKKQAKASVNGTKKAPDKIVLGWVGRDQYRKQVWALFELMHYIKTGQWVYCSDCKRTIPMEYDPNLRRPRARTDLRTYPRNYDYQTCVWCKSKNVTPGTPRNNVELWSHMKDRPDEPGSYNLGHLAWIYDVHDIVSNPSMTSDDRGIPIEALNVFYNALDVFLFPSGGEGFGLPVLEAMACGVPVVYSDYSAHADFAVGEAVRCRLFPEAMTQRYRAMVDMGDFIQKTLLIVDDHGLRHKLGKRAERVAAGMSWDHFTSRWISILNQASQSQPDLVYGEVA